jgi:TPR repeat protein
MTNILSACRPYIWFSLIFILFSAHSYASENNLPLCGSDFTKNGIKNAYENSNTAKMYNNVLFDVEDPQEVTASNEARFCIGIAVTNSGKRYFQYKITPMKGEQDYYIEMIGITATAYSNQQNFIATGVSAVKGDVVAQNKLGNLYSRDYMRCQSFDSSLNASECIGRNDKEAARWYRKAAEQGYSAAQLSLGHFYRFGHGVDKNYAEARKWYEMALAQGEPGATLAIDGLNTRH